MKTIFPTIFPFRYGIFLKLLMTFLAVCIPIFIVSSLMNQSGVNVIRQQVLLLMEQKSEYLISSIDKELKRIFFLQEHFLQDSDLHTISISPITMSRYEYAKTISDLRSKLTTLEASSKYIKEVFVLFPNHHKRLSASAGISDLDAQELARFVTTKPAESGLVTLNEQLFFPMGVPYLTNNQFLFVIELSTERISEDLIDPTAQGHGISYIKVAGNDTSFIIPAQNISKEQQSLIQYSSDSDDTMFKMKDQNYLRFSQSFTFADWTFVTLAQEDYILQPVHSFKLWSYVLYTLSIAVVLIISVSLLRFIHKPLRQLMQAFKKVEIGQFDIHLRHGHKDEFHYLFQHFNQMTNQLKVLVKEVYEQTIRSQRAELKQLQSQINPHFLYNSLYIVYRLAQDEDFEGTSTLTKQLGDYFKFITQNQADFIPLKMEIEHAKIYTSIQQFRIGKRIQFHFQEHGTLDDWEVPRLIIQPFLENAIVHGLENVMRDGCITIRITAAAHRLEIEIEDNGKGMSQEQLDKWKIPGLHADEFGDHALWNIHRRLQLRYGENSGLSLHINSFGGLTAALMIQEEGSNK